MPPLVTIDARDASLGELRGWGRYAARLTEALSQLAPDDLELDILARPGRGPEVVFEQLALPAHLRRRRSAIVHATNCFLPLLRPCPGVVTVHDLAFEAWPDDFRPRTRWKYRVLARLAARSAQRVIVPSAFTRQDLIARYGVDPARIRVIPEAPALPEGDLTPPAGPYVLAVGDLRRKKNLRALVSAFAELHRRRRPPHRLLLVGLDSGEGTALEGLSAGAPVELCGYVSDPQLDALIRGATVLVHPSRYEGFGLVVLEAMARGTPVLAADATALPQTAGGAAALFDPVAAGSERALGSALERLLADPAERERLSARGRRRAAEFSWRQAALATAAVYRELL